MQEILFTGVITSEPKTYVVPPDQQVGNPPDKTYCHFNVAATRSKRPGKKRPVDYYSVKCYNQRGEFAQKYSRRGMKVFVKGELQPEIIERPSGKLEILLNVRAYNTEFLGRREDINETILAMGQEGQEEYIDIAEDLIVGW